jgi:hypothetical protein
MADLKEITECLLGSLDDHDLNSTGETTIFTCPPGKSCIITRVVMRSASAAIGTASISFGWNTSNADDVIANAVKTLTGAGYYEIIPAKSDAVIGTAGGTFKIDVNTAEGAADTADFDVFGYFF